MTARKRPDGTGTDAATLLAGAATGDVQAFDGLFRRYGPEAWRYSSGVAGDDTIARYAVADGFATTVVAARDGLITHPGGFRRSLLHASRLRVAERDDPAAPGHARSTVEVAPAFASLPELMRSVLWLEHVHQLRANRVAEVTGIDPGEVADLSRRAHHGLAVHHLEATARGADEACRRALRNSARSLARRLPVRERTALKSHLASCERCRTAVAVVDRLDSSLPALAAAFPEDLLDETRAAWLVAIAPPSSTGLSPMVEKILAAASATAAVVAIAGAAYWRGKPASDTVAVSPVLHQVGGPIPSLDDIDLSDGIEFPEATDKAGTGTKTGTGSADKGTGSSGDSSTASSGADSSGSTSGLSTSSPTVSPDAGAAPESDAPTDGGSTGGGTDAPGDSTGDTGGGTTDDSSPLLQVSIPLGDQTVSVNIGGGDLIETGSAESGDTVEANGTLVDTVTGALATTGGAVGSLLGG